MSRVKKISKATLICLCQAGQTCEWRSKLLTTCDGHGQSGWYPVGCEGFYFHARFKNRVSVNGWPSIGFESFHTNLNIPSPIPTTLAFQKFRGLLIYICDNKAALSVQHRHSIFCYVACPLYSFVPSLITAGMA